MAVKTKNKAPVVTGDIGAANVTAKGPPSQQRGPLLGAGGMGVNNAGGDPRAQCTTDGEPVDVVSGAVMDNVLEVVLPGLVQVCWNRLYSSINHKELTPLGRGGWTHEYHQYIDEVTDKEGTKLAWRGPGGRTLSMRSLAVGDTLMERGIGAKITRPSQDRYEIFSYNNQLTCVFRSDGPGQRAWLREIVTPRQARVTFEYQGEVLSRIVDTAGRQILLLHDGEQRIVAVQVWAHGVQQSAVQYAYSSAGELSSATDSCGAVTTYSYDGSHRLVEKTFPNGLTVRYRYDDTGRCVRCWADGGLFDTEFLRDDQAGTCSVVGVPEPRVYTYDERHAIVREEVPGASYVIEKEYDSDLLLVTERNGNGDEFHFEYDDAGNLVRYVDAAGNETRMSYDDGLLKQIEHDDGRVVTREHNSFRELIVERGPSGSTLRGTWDRDGRLVTVSNDSGDLARYAYDAEHNLVQTTGTYGASTTYEHNAVGRTVRKVDPFGNVTRWEYDAMCRPVLVEEPGKMSTRIEYDGMGCAVRIDRNAHTNLFDYAGLGMLTRYVEPDGSEWRFAYDTQQRLLQIENPRKERYQYEYDAAGRVASERTFDGRTIDYEYDPASRLRRVQYGDGTFRTFEYDKLGNLLVEDSPHGRISYQRDQKGYASRVALEEGPRSIANHFTRDGLGRIVREEQEGGVVEYEYDAFGRCAARELDDGTRTQYEYDALGQLLRVVHNGRQIEIERDNVGRQLSCRFATTGAGVQSSYDGLGNLVRTVATTSAVPGLPGTVLLARDYTYNAEQLLVATDDSIHGRRDFVYDPASQLQQVIDNGNVTRFDYDANGSITNIIDSVRPSGPWTIAQGNRLLRTNEYEYEYDVRGRRVTQRGLDEETAANTEYIWDCRDRLREVRLPDGIWVRYFYDAAGRRVEKQVSRVDGEEGSEELESTFFLWDGAVLAAEHDGKVRRAFVHHSDQFTPLLQSEGGETYLYVHDQVGTPIGLVDPGGGLAWTMKSDVWGACRDPAENEAALRSPFGHLGHYRDTETGLSYVTNRYFDPEVGRWISPDPIGLDGGVNLYAFNGNPLHVVDPLGLAGHGETGTYGGLNGSSHTGDQMDADEVLLHGYMKARQGDMRAEYQREFTEQRGTGRASRDNPAIALQERKSDWGYPGNRSSFGAGTHERVWQAERNHNPNLHDPAQLRKMTALQVIDAKIGILRQVLSTDPEFQDKRKLNKKLKELREAAIEHARTIFKPCSKAAQGLW